MHPSPRPLRSLPERSACPRSEHSAHAALPGIGAGFHALGPMMTVWARLTRERMRPDQPRASFCLLFRCTGTLAAIQGMSVQNAFIVMHDSQGAAPKPRRPTGWPCGGIAEMCRFIRVSRDRGRGLAMHTRVSLLHLAEGPAVLFCPESPLQDRTLGADSPFWDTLATSASWPFQRCPSREGGALPCPGHAADLDP